MKPRPVRPTDGGSTATLGIALLLVGHMFSGYIAILQCGIGISHVVGEDHPGYKHTTS